MINPSSVQVTGVLARFAQGFGVRLEQLCYAAGSRAEHLRLMNRLSDWLGSRGLDGSGLSAQAAEEFTRERRAAGHRDARSVRSLMPLLDYLREIGAAPPPTSRPVAGPVDAVLAGYAGYLARERGLSVLTIKRNTDLVR